MIPYLPAAAVVESVDTGDLKSPGSDTVRVRVPSAAPKKAPLWGAFFGFSRDSQRATVPQAR